MLRGQWNFIDASKFSEWGQSVLECLVKVQSVTSNSFCELTRRHANLERLVVYILLIG